MDEIEFFGSIVVRMGGSFVEVEPNHFVISHLPQDTALNFIKRFGSNCLVEYRPEKLFDEKQEKHATGRSSV